MRRTACVVLATYHAPFQQGVHPDRPAIGWSGSGGNDSLHRGILSTPSGKGALLVLTPIEQRRILGSHMSHPFAFGHLRRTGLGECKIARHWGFMAFAQLLSPSTSPFSAKCPSIGM